jgi:hypothetical protein
MSLFTDTNVTSPDLLMQLDPEAESVLRIQTRQQADAPGLTLDNLCLQAWQECRSKLEAALASFSMYVGTAGSEAHIAAVLNTGVWGAGTRARLILNQVISSDTYYAQSLSPLERWVTYVALRLTFQTAADRFDTGGKGDRYGKKEARYAERAKQMWAQVVAQGMPFTASYLDCPGSVHGWQSGIWDTTCLSLSPDPNNTNANDIDVRIAITYYDSSVYISPTQKMNGESGPSTILSTTIPAGQIQTVNIAGLNPPTSGNVPNVGLSQGVAPRLNTTHWQIYAGSNTPGSPLYLQAPAIPIANKTASLPATLQLSGPQIDNGQVPDSRGSALFGDVVVRG